MRTGGLYFIITVLSLETGIKTMMTSTDKYEEIVITNKGRLIICNCFQSNFIILWMVPICELLVVLYLKGLGSIALPQQIDPFP